ncbi:MAG: DUF1570 domain-containing protein, partial [Planctomycetes bacterium]|nr:DUF1570 domain-containing protein [Planctomycetota bacterium]
TVAVSVEEWSGEGLTGRKLTTEHFDIVSTVRDAEFEAALPAFLEAAYEQYEATLPGTVDVDTRLTTYIFGSRSEWMRFTRRRFPARYKVYSRIRAGGFTEGDQSVSFYATRAAALATLAHEGWHQFVGARLTTPIPAWLNEGLACYHEAVDFAGSAPRFTPRHNTFRINSLRDALKLDRLLPLSEIIDTNAGEVITHGHSGVAQVYYAQVWALVTFLKHGADGRHAVGLQLMLDHIADGSFHVRSSAARLTEEGGWKESAAQSAFRTYFSHSVEEIAEPYHEHLMRIAGFRAGGAPTPQ